MDITYRRSFDSRQIIMNLENYYYVYLFTSLLYSKLRVYMHVYLIYPAMIDTVGIINFNGVNTFLITLANIL